MQVNLPEMYLAYSKQYVLGVIYINDALMLFIFPYFLSIADFVFFKIIHLPLKWEVL